MPNRLKQRYHTGNIHLEVKLLKQDVPIRNRNKEAGGTQIDFPLVPDLMKCLHSEGEGVEETNSTAHSLHLLDLTDFQRPGLPDSAYLSENYQMI